MLKYTLMAVFSLVAGLLGCVVSAYICASFCSPRVQMNHQDAREVFRRVAEDLKD